MDFNAFMKTVTPKAISANWKEAATNGTPYMGEALFPRKRKAGLDLAWIKGNKGLPISLMPSAFDAKATFRDRIGVNKLELEMPFFREGFKIKEKDRQNILRAIDTNDPYVREIIAKVFDDANELIEGARVVAERMRMQLLFPLNGNVGITIQANGVDYTYNYDQNEAWKTSNFMELAGDGKWTSPTTSDPFSDIQNGKDIVASKGGETRLLAMNTNTFKLLRTNKQIMNRFLTTSGLALGYANDGDIINVLKDTMQLSGILLYDKQYRDENKVAHKYVPDNYVALLPDGVLGDTYLGTTPEEADLKNSNLAQVQIVDTGVAVTQIIDPHPVNVNTFASEIVLPSYERMDEVVVIKVA